MNLHLSKDEVLALAASRGHTVIGDAVFSTMLGCYAFIVALGRGDVECVSLGTSVFVPVLKRK